MFLSLTRLITVGSVLFKSVDNSLLFTVLAKMGRLSDSCVFLMIPKSTIAFVRWPSLPSPALGVLTICPPSLPVLDGRTSINLPAGAKDGMVEPNLLMIISDKVLGNTRSNSVMPNLLGPSMFKFRSLVLVPSLGTSKPPVAFGRSSGLSVLMFLCLRLILLVLMFNTWNSTPARVLFSQLLRSLLVLPTMVIKLVPTMTLLPLLIRKAVSVSALPVGERLWLLLLLILNLNLLKRKPPATGASRKWYGVHSPSRPAPPQAKKVRTLEPGHDNHIIDPDAAVYNNWKNLIKVATETVSFVLSASLICLRLPLLNPPLKISQKILELGCVLRQSFMLRNMPIVSASFSLPRLILMLGSRIMRSLRIGAMGLLLKLLPLGLSRINRPEVVSHLRARSVSYRFW